MQNIIRKVHGIACPFNVMNVYNEAIGPDAFDKFLSRHATVPMCVMHYDDEPVGQWTEFTHTKDKLLVKGELWDPRAIELVEERLLPELSISFKALDFSPETYTEKRLNMLRDYEGVPARVLRQATSLPSVTTHNAGLYEISLVDKGAFKGCHLYLD